MGAVAMTDPREAVIDRILNGAPGPTDDTDREPDPPAWWDEERGLQRMEDAYEAEMDRRWE